MDDEVVDHLKSLHTNAIDARHGYEEALADSGKHSLTELFRNMIALHAANENELRGLLITAGEAASDDGSFMSTIHRTIMDIRSLFGGLDSSVIAGLVDGEKRNLNAYEKALALPGIDSATATILLAEHDHLAEAVAMMQALKPSH